MPRGTLEIVGKADCDEVLHDIEWSLRRLRRGLGELAGLRHRLQRRDAPDLRHPAHEHGIAIRGEYP
jgi:hypothetical protein